MAAKGAAKENKPMIRSNPLRNATHAIPVAVLSLLLLSAGMCQQAEDPSPAEVSRRHQ